MTTASVVGDRTAGLSLIQAWRDAKQVIRSDPALFGGLAFLQAIPSTYLRADEAQARLDGAAFSSGGAFWALVAVLLGLFVQIVLLFTALRRLDGDPQPPRVAFAQAPKLFLPLLGLAILLALGVVCGLVLLIVPGVMLFLAWYVAVPTLVAERRGVIDSLKRSAFLTRGSRWRILGLLLLAMLAFVLASVVLGVVTLILGDGGLGYSVALVGSVLFTAAYTAVLVALNAAVFVQLRDLKGEMPAAA